jgi:hypothetical protein
VNEQEQQLADMVYKSMQDFSNNSARGQQAQEFRVGISDLGYCSERTRRMLDQQVPEETDMLKAFIGTAIGDHVEQAVVKAFPTAISQAEVSLPLTVGDRTFNVPGHPDLVLPQGIVLDAKTSDGLALARRMGADQQKNFQRHGYGKAAWLAGLFDDDVHLDDVQVGNVWIDRSGDAQEVHVQLVPFDQDVLDDAARWLDEVIYAYIQQTEARKEPAREVCAATCGFFSVCRALDTDVQGLLTDPEVLEAVRMYREGLDLEKQGKSLKEQAKPALKGIAGSTGQHTVRWTHINETEVPASKRRGYDKIDVRPIK